MYLIRERDWEREKFMELVAVHTGAYYRQESILFKYRLSEDKGGVYVDFFNKSTELLESLLSEGSGCTNPKYSTLQGIFNSNMRRMNG